MADTLRHLRMTRRHFVGLGSAMIPGTLSPLYAAAQIASPRTLMVLIDEISDESDPSLVEDVLSEFTDRAIPVSCIIDIKRLNGSNMSEVRRLGATIRAVVAREPGMIELVMPVDEIGDGRRYFQMRAAETRRALAAAFLNETAGTAERVPIISLMDRHEEELVDLSAQRSAGFRVLIRPGASGAMNTEFVGNGQMRLNGSVTLSLAKPQEEIRARLDESLGNGKDLMLILSLSGITGGGTRRLRGTIAQIAARIGDALMSGAQVAMRPMDYLLAAGPYQSADRALVLHDGETGDTHSAVSTFAEELRAAGLPFTATGEIKPEWLTDGDDFCPDWGTAWSEEGFDARACLLSSAQVATPAPDRVPGLTIVPGDDGAWNGVRADGRMQLTFREWARTAPACDAPFEDLVLVIRRGDVFSPIRRQALMNELVSAVQEGRIRLHTVAGLADLVLAPEPVLTRLWSTRRRMVTDPPRADALSADERAMLLDDARLAWTFLNRFTDPVTGLCAGTVLGGAAMRVNLEASLWDLASQLQGIIAASAIGIIPADEARDRVQLMLRNIPAIELGGLSLPPAMFLTDPSTQVGVRGFDFCDTGRFLIALRSAVAAGLASDADAVATRSEWDLAAVVEDGTTYSISDGRRLDVTTSHCTPYIARTFAGLGLPLRSPYSEIGEGGEAGDLVRLLYSAAFVGSLGTEPLLLEAIEQGASPEAKYLSAVLFDAQLSWFETTGQMKSVSEAPLNMEPWFVYQGLRVDRLGAEAWTIESPNGAPRFQTPEFLLSAEVLSAKSAFLWAAVHPHPYCDMLMSVMREKARIEDLGFSVGVFTHTREPMENYSDLNTNGIILSAIGAMLDPSWPNL